MDFVSKLMSRLESLHGPLNLVHFQLQNWIVFLRGTIDCLDDQGDPLLSQFFLLEISTGRYVHRAQGQKLDAGTSLDVDLIEAKISTAFSGTQLCPGFPIQDVLDAHRTTRIVEYPWRRQVSRMCQAIFTPCVKQEQEHAQDRDQSTACQPCIQAWQELTCNDDVPEVVRDTRDLLVKDESGDMEADEFLDIGGALPEDYVSESSYEEDNDCPWAYETPSRVKTRPHQPPKGKRASSRKRKTAKEELEEPPIDGKTYPCDHCSKVFTRRRNLRVHKSHLKRESRQVDCKEKDCQVEKIPSLKKLVDHVTACHPESLHKYRNYLPDDQDKDKMKEPQQCSICDLVFNGSIYILRHRQLYHEIGDFECVECAESCLTYYDLVLHNHQKHSKATEYIKPHTEGIQVITHEDGKIENRRGTLTCTLCDKRYANDAGFLKHMRHKHSWGVLECLPCNEVCHYAKDFFAHSVRFHAQSGEVKCPTCGVGFAVDSPEAYVSHYAVCDPSFKMSKQDGSCQCQYCGMQFLSKLAFGNHVKSHEGFERFKCTFCEYGSNNKTVLLDHEKTHLREKGLTNGDSTEVLYYHCDKCEKRFNSTNALRLHKKRVHEGIKRLFKCRECGAWFKSNTPLYKHRQAEHGYVPGRLGKNRRRIVNFQCK